VGVRLGGVERTAGRGRVRAVGRRSCESCACAAPWRGPTRELHVTNTQTSEVPTLGLYQPRALCDVPHTSGLRGRQLGPTSTCAPDDEG
jgi:hypothetical protein